jgi:hypothetical protein
MRLTSLILATSLIAAPAFAQDISIQEANPRAAAQAGAAAQQQHYDARRDVGAARHDERVAHIDAAHGNYGAAAAAQHAAGADMGAARQHNADSHYDASRANQDSTTTIRVTP